MRPWFLAGLTVLAACGSNEQSTTVAGTTFTNNDKDGTATISNGRGSVSTLTADAARAKMPDFAPLYPGATIDSALDSERDGRKSSMINIVTTDSVRKVGEFYKAKFASGGLTLKNEMINDEASMVAAEGNGKKASVAVSSENGKTSAVVSFTVS